MWHERWDLSLILCTFFEILIRGNYFVLWPRLWITHPWLHNIRQLASLLVPVIHYSNLEYNQVCFYFLEIDDSLSCFYFHLHCLQFFVTYSSEWFWGYFLLGWLVRNIGPDCHFDIHVPQRMNPIDFGILLTYLVAPPEVCGFFYLYLCTFNFTVALDFLFPLGFVLLIRFKFGHQARGQLS